MRPDSLPRLWHYINLLLTYLLKNSNLCDHNPPTLQTDGQTTCDRKTALCTKVHRAVKSKCVLGKTDAYDDNWVNQPYMLLRAALKTKVG